MAASKELIEEKMKETDLNKNIPIKKRRTVCGRQLFDCLLRTTRRKRN